MPLSPPVSPTPGASDCIFFARERKQQTDQRYIGWDIDLLHGQLSLNGVTVILQA